MFYRVLVVEDDPMARQLFELFVEQNENYHLAASIRNADLADVCCESQEIDLIIMDIRTASRSNGLDAAERIKQKFPKIRIIIVTSMPEFSYLKRAREIGVDSFWYKEISKEPFTALMDRTMAGEHIFPEDLPEIRLGNAFSGEFTERELIVLRELTSGDPDFMIAERLNLSVATVKTHIQHLRDKTGFRNRTELAVKARESGIVILDR